MRQPPAGSARMPRALFTCVLLLGSLLAWLPTDASLLHAQSRTRVFEDTVRARIRSMLPDPSSYVPKDFTHTPIFRAELLEREIALLDRDIAREQKALGADSLALATLKQDLAREDTVLHSKTRDAILTREGKLREALDARVAQLGRLAIGRSGFARQLAEPSARTDTSGFRVRHRFAAKDKSGAVRTATFDFTFAPDGRLAGVQEVRSTPAETRKSVPRRGK